MAGLLDFLNLGSSGGGILDAILNHQQFPGQQNADQVGWPLGAGQQQASFSDRWNAMPQQPPATFAGRFAALPNADAPSMATPMKIGDYQMPRIGSEMQYASIPQQAQPAQGQAQPQMGQAPAMPQQAPALPPALGGGIGSVLGRIGAPDGLIARLTGNDPRSIAQQNLKAQYDVLSPLVGPQKAMLAVLNPEAGKTIIAQAMEKKQYGFTKLDDGTVVSQDPQTGNVQLRYGQPNAKFSDVAELRKEVGNLPEVKRYAEAAPIYNSMIKNMNVNTAAADLDFVYGVAKIFDPESVVREGEMKLVGKAQSLPEDIKGLMGQVAMAKGRLTPEARQRILEVAQTRMGELRGAYDTRVNPYSDIAKRFNARPEDVIPSVPAMSELPKPQTEAPAFQDGMTATNPKTGQKLVFRNGIWQ